MYQECTRNPPGLYQECTRNVPGMYQEFSRNPGIEPGLPGILQEYVGQWKVLYQNANLTSTPSVQTTIPILTWQTLLPFYFTYHTQYQLFISDPPFLLLIFLFSQAPSLRLRLVQLDKESSLSMARFIYA
jgi:hypothetical protein